MSGELSRFMIEDPSTGEFIVVHNIYYANTSTETSLRNPFLHIEMVVENTTNATNIAMFSDSAMGFVECDAVSFFPSTTDPLAVPRLQTNSISIVANVTTCILLIRNRPVASSLFNGIANRIILTFNSINFTCTGNKTVAVRIIRNPTLGGVAPVYTDTLATQSPTSYSKTAGVTVADGTVEFETRMMKEDRITSSLSEWSIDLIPDEVIAVTVLSTGISDVELTLKWAEGF